MKAGVAIFLIILASLGSFGLGWDEGAAAQLKSAQTQMQHFNQTHRCMNWPLFK